MAVDIDSPFLLTIQPAQQTPSEPRVYEGSAIVRYEHSELGVLYPDRGVAELPVLDRERDVLVEHGNAEPAEPTGDAVGISHSIHGPSDITAVLELFDRRYRDGRGEDDPYSSDDPAYPHGRAGPALAQAQSYARGYVVTPRTTVEGTNPS
jgi:hypothetical protein